MHGICTFYYNCKYSSCRKKKQALLLYHSSYITKLISNEKHLPQKQDSETGFELLLYDTRIMNAGHAKYGGPVSPEKTLDPKRATSKNFKLYHLTYRNSSIKTPTAVDCKSHFTLHICNRGLYLSCQYASWKAQVIQQLCTISSSIEYLQANDWMYFYTRFLRYQENVLLNNLLAFKTGSH